MKTTALFCLGLLLVSGATLAAQTPGSCGVTKTTYVNVPHSSTLSLPYRLQRE